MNPREVKAKLKMERPKCEKCFGCTIRYVGCRSTCEDWKKYEAKHEEYLKKREEVQSGLSAWYDSNEMNTKYIHQRKRNKK